MTSPRSTYGGGYYSAPSFADTPIYDSLVAERGTPQIAPIRVPAAYDTGNSHLPALPSALPALPGPAAPQQAPAYGYQQAQQPMPLQQAVAPAVPQPPAPRGYPAPQAHPAQYRPVPTGYEAMRPAAARPAPAPAPYQDPYNRPYQGQGY
ncbi:DUF6643 family protein [Streptomyces yaizuensis]|uniref:Uncharacterized protein n=1 Tax=Streptomyces yaizuensis TaxID=2989713 RepID=A0ABQ5P3A8_9ACTN|nr:DUF6643 family protein [Streptomyces sp. YSPA8]GLF97079.1 hypothetical protein SYYSPA8_22300 [Streptomyces sp. YSPA8]